MSSQKIGPSSLASRVRSWIGACGSSDSMLPTTGLVGGCGIGLSLFLDGIVENVSPWARLNSSLRLNQLKPSFRGDAKNPESRDSGSGASAPSRNDKSNCAALNDEALA